ncbi:hypothetical protein GCM10028857_20870 [Salinarchaeum chitinilyticum]
MDDTNSADDTSIVSSRRSILAATFGIPVLGGVGVGAADTVRRLTDADLADAESIGPSADAADVTVDFASGRHPIEDDRYTQITLDPELLEDLDVDVGDQVRLHRGDTDRAIYTVAAAMTEADASTVRMNRRARARLDIANTAWAQVGDYGTGCPELLGTSDLVDETFDAIADPVVVSDSSIEAAQENGELVEDAAGDGTELAILAPHGGDVEPYTAEQASDLKAAVDADASVWRALGYRPEGGAFLRWHVPSDAISPASFPELEALLADDYDHAISFHGICTNQVRVGGGAPESVKQHVVDSINYHLPASASRAEIANGRFSAQDPDVLANRASGNGVWIGQPPEIRTDHADVVVDAVASAVADW